MIRLSIFHCLPVRDGLGWEILFCLCLLSWLNDGYYLNNDVVHIRSYFAGRTLRIWQTSTMFSCFHLPTRLIFSCLMSINGFIWLYLDNDHIFIFEMLGLGFLALVDGLSLRFLKKLELLLYFVPDLSSLFFSIFFLISASYFVTPPYSIFLFSFFFICSFFLCLLILLFFNLFAFLSIYLSDSNLVDDFSTVWLPSHKVIGTFSSVMIA